MRANDLQRQPGETPRHITTVLEATPKEPVAGSHPLTGIALAYQNHALAVLPRPVPLKLPHERSETHCYDRSAAHPLPKPRPSSYRR